MNNPDKATLNEWLAKEFLEWDVYKFYDEPNVWMDKDGFHRKVVGEEDFFNPEGLATVFERCVEQDLCWTLKRYKTVNESGENVWGILYEANILGAEGLCANKNIYTAFYMSLWRAFA